MTDRFEALISRRAKVGVFGPGVLWRKFGNNETLHKVFGDDFPAVFVPLEIDPPEFGPGSRYEFREEHFGAHAFLEFRVSEEGPSWQKEIKGVAALCLLDPACREAALHLLEATRNGRSELGEGPTRFRFGAARIPRTNIFVTSPIIEMRLPAMLNAYMLWQITPEGERPRLADSRCPLCRVRA